MNQLDDLVKGFIKQNEEDAPLIKQLVAKQAELIAKQEEKIKQTATKLMPVMELIASKGYRFKGKDTDYFSGRGPIIKHDKRENKLYIFSVERKRFITVDLHDDETKLITYQTLLREVDFTQIMDSLLMVLHFNDEVKELYKKSNSALEAELDKFGDI